MAKNYSVHYKERTYATTGEEPRYLLEITHPQLAVPIRVINDTENLRRISPGQYLNLPESTDDNTEVGYDVAFTLASLTPQVGPSTIAVTRSGTNAVQRKRLSENYLHLNGGTGGGYTNTPHSATHYVSGDLDVRAKVYIGLIPAASTQIVAKGTTGDWGWRFVFNTGGRMQLDTSTDGTTFTSNGSSSVVSLTTTIWIRATLDADDGAGNRVTTHYTSTDYNPDTGEGTWTPAGTNTTAGTITIFNSTSALGVGAAGNGGSNAGPVKIFYAEVRNGIDGPVVVSFDADDGTPTSASFASSRTGEVWTLQGLAKIVGTEIEAVAANTPRFDYHPLTLACRGLLVEDSVVNDITYSSAFSDASWTGVAVVSSNVAIAPDGTFTVDEIADDDAATFKNKVVTGMPVTAGKPSCVSLFVRKDSIGRATRFPIIRMAFVSDATRYVDVRLDTSTGATSTAIGGSTGDVTISGSGAEDRGTYWRLWISGYTTHASWTSSNITIYPAAGASATWTYNVTATGSIFAWGAQHEDDRAYPSSVIVTAGAAGTRSADVVQITDISSFFNANEGTLVAEFSADYLGSSISRSICAFDDNSTSNRIQIYLVDNTTDKASFITVVSGTPEAQFSAGSAYVPPNVMRAAGVYKVNDFALSVDGSAIVSDTTGNLPTVSRLKFGCVGAVTFLNGHLRRITYLKKRVLNQTLQILASGGMATYTEEYIACKFRIQFPEDIAQTMPRVPASIDNIGRELTQWLEASNGGKGAEFRIMQVMRDTPDVVEQEYTLTLIKSNQNVMEVTGELGYENVMDQPCLAAVQTPETSPGIF